MKQKLIDWIFQTPLLALGSFICAFAVKALLIPQGFLSGGLTGAALVVYYSYPLMSIALIYLLINIPVFILGWLFVGIRFILYSLWGMLIYSAMLYFITFRFNISDQLLSAVVAGGISGIGIAIILKSYGSTGGTEIISVILCKLFSLSVGTGTVLVNVIVLAVSLLFFPIEKVLYSIVYTIVSMQATNCVFHGLNKRKAVLIISDRWQEIAKDLTYNFHVGITKLSGKGGYGGANKTILFSVVRRKDISILKKASLKKDPNAFITVMAAEDVTGLQVGNQPHW